MWIWCNCVLLFYSKEVVFFCSWFWYHIDTLSLTAMASSQHAQAETFCIFCGQLLDKESSIGFGCCSRHGLHVKCSLHMCGLPAAASHYIWTGDCSFFEHINDKNYYCCTSSGWNRLRIHTLCQDLLKNDKEGTWWYIFKGASGFSCDCPLCLL